MVIQKMVIHYIMNVLVQNTLTKIKRRQAGKVYDTFLILTNVFFGRCFQPWCKETDCL